MKLLLTLTAIAAISFHRFAVEADTTCPSGTVNSDQAPACNTGSKPEESPVGSKCWKCVSSHESCPKDYIEKDGVCCLIGSGFPAEKPNCTTDQTLDVDSDGCWKCLPCKPPSHVSNGHCCPDGQEWSTSRAFPSQPGKCCMKDHSLTVSEDGKSSSCCVTGATYENGKCIPPAGPDPGSLRPTNADDCTTCAACEHDAVCPDVTTKGLGINYGKCYVLEYSKGKTIGRHPGGEYQAPGYFPDVAFKVCDQSHQCEKTGSVGHKDFFTLWDVVGHQDWVDGLQNGNRGFFSHNGGHEAITTNPDIIAKFLGRPSCLDGQYGVCIHVEGKGAGPACPADPTSFYTYYLNSKACLRFVFKPVTCPELAEIFTLN